MDDFALPVSDRRQMSQSGSERHVESNAAQRWHDCVLVVDCMTARRPVRRDEGLEEERGVSLTDSAHEPRALFSPG